jgi:aspartate/methionine/tyrosine aminotransferase
MSLPNHLDSITSFLAMEVFGRAQELEKQGHSILHLEFGEPDVSPPPWLVSDSNRLLINTLVTPTPAVLQSYGR